MPSRGCSNYDNVKVGVVIMSKLDGQINKTTDFNTDCFQSQVFMTTIVPLLKACGCYCNHDDKGSSPKPIQMVFVPKPNQHCYIIKHNYSLTMICNGAHWSGNTAELFWSSWTSHIFSGLILRTFDFECL